MKKILTLILIFTSIASFSQTTVYTAMGDIKESVLNNHSILTDEQLSELDSILFYKINEYRRSKGRKKLTWDESSYKASKHHSLYMFTTKHFSHSETKNVNNIKLLKNPSDRFSFYSNSDYISIGECITKSMHNPGNLDIIANGILKQWINSPPHNAILLDRKFNIGAISSVSDSNFDNTLSTFMGAKIK